MIVPHFLFRDSNGEALYIMCAPFHLHVFGQSSNKILTLQLKDRSFGYYLSDQMHFKLRIPPEDEKLYSLHDMVHKCVGGFFSPCAVRSMEGITKEEYETYKEFGIEDKWLTPIESIEAFMYGAFVNNR